MRVAISPADGQLVDADIARRHPGPYRCPYCGTELVIRVPRRAATHFAHPPRTSCLPDSPAGRPATRRRGQGHQPDPRAGQLPLFDDRAPDHPASAGDQAADAASEPVQQELFTRSGRHPRPLTPTR